MSASCRIGWPAPWPPAWAMPGGARREARPDMRQLSRQTLQRCTLAAALALLAPASGCSGAGTSAAPSGAPATQAPEERPQAYELVPEAQRTKYLAALKKISRALADREELALSQGVNVCQKIYAGDAQATLVKYTGQEFGNTKRGAQVLQATRRWLCTSKELRAHYKPRGG